MGNIYFKSVFAAAAGAALLLLSGCNTAKVADTRPLDVIPRARPPVIYVADFDLPPGIIQQQGGLLTPLRGGEGPVGGFLRGHAADPQVLSAQLVDLMANSMVAVFEKAGFPAQRLPAGTTLPAVGWLVRGSFTEVQQGNRMSRAIVGLGMGKTEVQVVACVDDLTHGPPKSFYQLQTDANSRKTPGAAATLVLSPIAVPVHFVLAGRDLETNVKDTAAKVAHEILLRTKLEPALDKAAP